jgi:hypothetical protein
LQADKPISHHRRRSLAVQLLHVGLIVDAMLRYRDHVRVDIDDTMRSLVYPLVAAVLALATAVLAPRGLEASWLLFAQDQPAMIAERAVDQQLTPEIANGEIAAALDAGDIDLANSFVELAQAHGIVVDAALTEKLVAANSTRARAARNVRRFAHGLVSGQPEDAAGLAGTAVGDLFVVGDIRDAVREGTRLASGEEADETILGLACVGIAVTAGTYVSLGIAAPLRVGLSIIKVARKTGRLGGRLAVWIARGLRETIDMSALRRALATVSVTEPAVAVRAAREAVKVDKLEDLARVVGDVGTVEVNAGSQAALDTVKLAEGPGDMARFASLAEAEGGKTRAIIKLVGRAAITLSIAAFDLFSWALATLLALLGFAGTVKRMAERMTLRFIRQRKARRERARILTMSRLQTA